MKYAITPDKKIHQVVNEDDFYKYHPDAQDVTMLKNIHKKFMEQERKESIIKDAEGLEKLGYPIDWDIMKKILKEKK